MGRPVLGASRHAGLVCAFFFSPVYAGDTPLQVTYLWSISFVLVTLLVAALGYHVIRLQGRLSQSVDAQQQSGRREKARTEVLDLLAQGAPLECILEAIVIGVERNNPGILASVLLFDEENSRLKLGAAPSFPEFYNAAIDGVEVGSGVGSCGTAAYTGKRVIVDDIMVHSYWEPYRELASMAGLAACWSEPFWSSSGKLLGTFAIYHRKPTRPVPGDIELIEEMASLAEIAVERSQNLADLRCSEKQYRLLADNVSDVIWTMAPDGGFTYISPSVERLSGYRPDELMSQTLEQVLTPESAALARLGIQRLYDALDSGQRPPSSREELQQYCNSGTPIWTEVSTNCMFDQQGDFIGLVGVSRDITERKQAERQLAHMASYDQLTNLPNRTLFSDRLNQAMVVARREKSILAVIFIDLDRFKPINDTHGHAVGDLLLKEAAGRMSRSVRESDTVARIGGDEFIVLLHNVHDAQNALMVANKIRRGLADDFEIEGINLNISSSIGIAIYPEHGDSEMLLTRHADLAMYQAKRAGRDRVTLFQNTWAEGGFKSASLINQG